jgi:FKBP-type peptidyl-prolyl cis-trans isomerase
MKRVVCALIAAAALTGLALTVSAAPQSDDKNKDKSDKTEKKWTKTATGLQYLDEKVGSGAAVRYGDKVEVHYTGTFKDGKEFDSSKKRGKPFEFTVGAGQVIRGWEEGLMGMKVGGTRKLIIPYQLAYGEEGRPPAIPPKAELHSPGPSSYGDLP